MSLKTPLEDIALKKAVEVAWLTLAFFIPNAVWYSCFHAGSPFGNVAGFFFSNCVSCLPYVTLFLLAFRYCSAVSCSHSPLPPGSVFPTT
jgi:hypothetical protein